MPVPYREPGEPVPVPLRVEFAEDVFWTAVNVLQKLELPWVVYAGQCLGIYRENQIMPHGKDTDLDFALIVYGNDDEAKLRDQMRAAFEVAGFAYVGCTSVQVDGQYKLCQFLASKDLCLVDVMVYHASRDMQTAFGLMVEGRKEYPLAWFMGRQGFWFKRMHLPMIWPAVEYLRLTYGEGWMLKPSEKRVWSEETHALQHGKHEWI